MKKCVLAMLTTLLILSFISPAISKASTIAFVNLKEVLYQSQIGKNARAQIKNLIEAKKMVIQRKREQLNKLLKKIKSKNISQNQKKKLEKEYQKLYRDLEVYQAQASQEVRQKEIQETNKVLKLAIDTIKKYAKSHHIDGVFEISQGNVIYWNDALDITQTIIKLMNKAK